MIAAGADHPASLALTGNSCRVDGAQFSAKPRTLAAAARDRS
jgi:hypothetical protein